MATQHKEGLRAYCRLCGMKNALPTDRLPYKKEKFSKAISSALQINVEEDDCTIYPPFICKSCERKLDRFRRMRAQKKTVDVNILIFEFKEHADDCNICVDVARVNIEEIISSCVPNLSSVGMCVSRQCDRTLFLSVRVQDENVTTIPKCVTLYNDATWHVSLVGQELKHCHPSISHFPPVLDKDSARDLVISVGGMIICQGNPDFVEFMLDKSRLGMPSRTFTICSFDKKTVRHRQCKLVEEGKERCSVCSVGRGDLMSWKEKKEKDQDRTSPSSSTKLEYLSHEQLKKRTKNVHREMEKTEKKRVSLRKKVATLFEKSTFTQPDKNQEAAISNLVTNCTRDLEEAIPPNTPASYLWQEQKKALSKKNKKQIRWSPYILRWCIAVHHKSAAAYKLLKDSGLLLLPAVSTLQEYTHFTDAKTGIHEDLIEQIMKDADLSQEHKRNIIVLFDEMKLCSGLAFQSSTGKLIGFVDVGDINSEFRIFDQEVQGEDEPPLASHALVLMARGIFSNMKQAVALFPTKALRSSEIYDCVMETILALECAGLTVRGIVSDGASINRRFYKMCGEQHKTVHPLDHDRQIYFFCDVPHLIKTTRNNLENSGFGRKSRNLQFQKKQIRWTHILDLYSWDSRGDLRMLPRITDSHLYLTPSLRMRVKLASQVMSQSVANAMKARKQDTKDDSMDGTCQFIEMMNKFFDCLNVSNINEGRRKRNPNLMPYESVDDSRFDWLVNVFLKYFEDWEKELQETPNLSATERERRCISKETREGFRITVFSFIALTKELLQEKGVKYVLSEKFSQDPIEEYFSKQRAAGGSSDNPSTLQVANNMLSIQVGGSAIRASHQSNVQISKGESVEDCPLPKKKRKR